MSACEPIILVLTTTLNHMYTHISESGFVHSSFTFAYESLLTKSTATNADLPPGALITFLQKGLQYLGIEEHLNEDGSERRCDEEWGLLSPHVCRAVGGKEEGRYNLFKSNDDAKARSKQVRVRLATQPRAKVLVQYNPPTISTHSPLLPFFLNSVCAKNKTQAPPTPQTSTPRNNSSSKKKAASNNSSSTLASQQALAQQELLKTQQQQQAELNRYQEQQASMLQNAMNQQAQHMQMTGEGGGLTAQQQQQNLLNANAGQVLSQQALQKPRPLMDDRDTAVAFGEYMDLAEHSSEVFMCAWNPIFTNYVATGSGDATARIWVMGGNAAAKGCTSSTLLKHGAVMGDKNKDVTTLEWSPDGATLATGSYDGVARVWSKEGEILFTLQQHKGPIFSLKWNKTGSRILSGSYDKSTIVWSATDGAIVQKYDYHQAPALDVDWRDDNVFASCSTDKRVCVCVVGEDGGGPVEEFEGHTDEVNAVKWDPSGTLLASCSDDGTAKVWKPKVSAAKKDGVTKISTPVWNFGDHSKEIYTIKWSPTGPGSKNPDKPLLLATAR